jgi:hypothetical protein
LFTEDSLGKRKYVQALQLKILYIQPFGELLTCAMPRDELLVAIHYSSPSSWKQFINSSLPIRRSLPATDGQYPFVQGIRDRLSYLLTSINDICIVKMKHRQAKEGNALHSPASSEISTLSEEQIQVMIYCRG